MVTDVTDAAETEVERARAPIPYPVRVVLTLLLLAAYVFGRRLNLPGVDHEVLLELRLGTDLSGILMLGLNPLITGFLLVELFSLMTSPGRRLRQLGTAGRATLNRAALIASLLLAGVQATGIARTLETMPSPGGASIVAFPGLGFMLITVATLTATTAALFALGQAISAYGIGNGFALLLLTRAVLSIVQAGSRSLTVLDAQFQGTILLLAVGAAVGIVLFFRRAEDAWLPAFPQGLVPAQVAVSVSPLVWLAIAWLVHIPRDVRPPAFAGPLMALVLIPLLSWATFHLFSSRARLQANLHRSGGIPGRSRGLACAAGRSGRRRCSLSAPPRSWPGGSTARTRSPSRSISRSSSSSWRSSSTSGTSTGSSGGWGRRPG